MPLKDILVHVDHYAGSAPRLNLAVDLAAKHQARLTGLLVIRHRYPVDAEVDAARDLFGQLAAAAGIEGRWRCVDGSAIDVGMTKIVVQHAHHCDLLIVGQGSRESGSVGVHTDLPERVVLETGRPVLVVPAAGTFPTIGERVLVAWKAGREWTRAVNDALPLLSRAQRVEILVKPGPGEDAESCCASLGEHLARHGVATSACGMLVVNTTVADALLNRVFDEGFDLLVTGAFARGPEDRRTLGAVARQLLEQMTVPVLMSH